MITLNRRRVIGVERLPYDAQVEFLESNGYQYIATGLFLGESTTSVKLVFDIEFTSLPSKSLLYATNRPTNGIQIYTNGVSVYNQGASQKVAVNTRYIIETNTTATSRSIKISNVETQNFSRTISDGKELNILGDSTNSAKGNASHSKCYSFTVYVNDIICRDLIPVRIGTTGYMYDKVSGQLFGNSGTGTFILGPDVISGG